MTCGVLIHLPSLENSGSSFNGALLSLSRSSSLMSSALLEYLAEMPHGIIFKGGRNSSSAFIMANLQY